MNLSIHHTTSKGRLHEKNEDCFYIGENYLIVADGMGGEGNGDVASVIAAGTVSRLLDERLKDMRSETDVADMLCSTIRLADQKISNYIDCHPECDGMGSTILVAVFLDGKVHLAWCGDSRCYACSGGRLCSLTKDHSYVQELVDAGEITLEESFYHPDSNLITRYVGGGPDACEPDYALFDLDDFDVLVLCSDGLSGYCRDRDISRTIVKTSDPEALPLKLRNLAVDNGSDDDITVITVAIGSSHNSTHSLWGGWLRRKGS